MPKSIVAPSVAETGTLLADLLCSPICMRADRLGALVMGLAPLVSPRTSPEQRAELFAQQRLVVGAPRRKADMEEEDEDSENDVYPWDEPIYEVKSGVATIDASGPVVKGYSNLICWWYGLLSTDRLQEALSEIENRNDVLAVVIRGRSPGGMATGTPETAEQITALRQKKLVVFVTDTMACSAMYWIGCASSTFFTTLSADVGCIGTYIAMYDYSEMLKEWGIKLELFKRGKYKAIGVMGNPLDKDARAFLDRDCGRTNDRFLAAVRANRPGVVDDTMEGQWFDGEEAVEKKLADEVVPSCSAVVARIEQAVAGALSSLAFR
jgi:signal peptide peptidase SppA